MFQKYHHRSFHFFLSRDSETVIFLADFKIRRTMTLERPGWQFLTEEHKCMSTTQRRQQNSQKVSEPLCNEMCQTVSSVNARIIKRNPSPFNDSGRRKDCMRFASPQYEGW